jgi:dienelactone hydrolase
MPPPQVSKITGASPAICFLSQPHALAVRFFVSAKQPVDGALSGSGPVGVVLAPQSDGNLCQWADYSDFLSRRGYRVLSLTFSTAPKGAPRDGETVVAAARTLRRLGARKVVLMGASRGGCAVLDAAGRTAVQGVIALSPPSVYETCSAESGVRRSHAPLLIAVGELDYAFVGDARTLYADARAKPKQLVVKTGSAEHGVDLLGYRPKALVDRAVLSLLARVRG